MPNSVALMVGRFWLYAMCRRSSKVFEQTMLPSAEVNATPPQLHIHLAGHIAEFKRSISASHSTAPPIIHGKQHCQ